MKKIFLNISLVIFLFNMIGCTSEPRVPKKPKVQTTKKFQLGNINLKLSQLVKTDITYHTQDELELLLIKQFKDTLSTENMLSTDKSMDKLSLNIDYKRRFLGDKTAIVTDSLNYPNIFYTIKINHQDNTIDTIEENLTFKVDFVRDLKVFAGGFRNKKYEIQFIDELTNIILNKLK